MNVLGEVAGMFDLSKDTEEQPACSSFPATTIDYATDDGLVQLDAAGTLWFTPSSSRRKRKIRDKPPAPKINRPLGSKKRVVVEYL